MLNNLSIEFPLAQVAPKRALSFVLKQARYAHDVATITFRDWDVQYENIKPGDPVKCSLIGQGPEKEFVGYIYDIKPEITPGKRTATITVIGASYRMKQAKQRVFENTTATQVVKTIAKEYGFKVEADAHPRVYPQIVQPGISDFQLLARLAQQSGFIFRVDNTTIKFKKPTTDYNANRGNAERFDMRNANDPKGSTLYSFNLILGESVKFSDAYKSAVQVGGVDPYTIETSLVTNKVRNETLRKVSSTEIFDSYATDTVAPDPVTAFYEAQSADERNRFPYRSHIRAVGAPSVAPGMPVYLDGVDKLYNGYWVVLSTEHHITQTNNNNAYTYTTFAQVGTDSLSKANALNNVKFEKPSAIRKRALVPGIRNYPQNVKSTLTVGTEDYSNPISQITLRGKGSSYKYTKPHLWVFDGQTTTKYVANSNKSAITVARKRS